MKVFIVWTAYALVLAGGALDASACAIFTVARDGKVLMGNNEDFTNQGVIWFVPGKGGRYGRVNVGFDNNFAQGSMNEQGLAFDSTALPKVPWEEDPHKETPKNLLEIIMNQCATVEEALTYFERYNCKHLAEAQFMFADATGAAAIVSWIPGTGMDVRRMEGDTLVVTNTRLGISGYRCQRYVKATQVLAKRTDASLDTMAAVLDAIHQRGPGAFTTYSTVYNLKKREIFVYNLANFDDVVVFDLANELETGKDRTRKLAKLFENSRDMESITGVPQRTTWDTRIELDDSVLDRYVGAYSPRADITVTIERDGNGGLLVHNPGQPPAVLFPESDTLFRIAPDNGQVSFRTDESGVVEGLVLHKQSDVFAARVDNP